MRKKVYNSEAIKARKKIIIVTLSGRPFAS